MSKIEGKISKVIYQNPDNSYVVALFHLSKVVEDFSSKEKIITITGNILDLKIDHLLALQGEYVLNEKYNKYQFNVKKYEYVKPTTKEGIIDYLIHFVEGCGETTAKKIVDIFKEQALEKIKENKENLLLVDGMTEKRAYKIYNSIIEFDKCDDIILKMQDMGFSTEDASKIINKYKADTDYILTEDFYVLKDLIDFKKLDNIYLQNNDPDTHERIYACTLQTLKEIAFQTGNTYTDKEQVNNGLISLYHLAINNEILKSVLKDLKTDKEIVIIDDKIYLMEYYDAEKTIAKNLKKLSSKPVKKIKDFETKIANLEEMLKIEYDDTQKKAIKEALSNNISIISGGPGTGKTTIVKAIVRLYIEINKLTPIEVIENIALLAPTGRAAKKLSQSTGLPAYTIHRYLKWYKESDEFLYNETNKTMQKFIIVDETSMVDISLFSALLKALSLDARLILVGDAFQLPSVGPGLVLNDLIKTELFNFIPLTKIYRQSDNSYIPYLAKEIKDLDLQEEFLDKKDDYNFIKSDSSQIRKNLEDIVLMAKKKKIDETTLQVLAPVYKGENGIDNLNIILQELFNPKKDNLNEIRFGDIIYREQDKVLQLVNDPDNNVYNGDIGYIESITTVLKPRRKEIISINFDGNLVDYEKKDLVNIKHAYAMSVHKSQGSEFDNVVMVMSKEYFYMLYNKLIYTGVSRAKKTLILLGDPMIFARAIQNDYASVRKTTLKENLFNEFFDE